jgi:hypothetical protein
MDCSSWKPREALMSLDARIRELSARHRNLETAILDEMKRPACDEMRLTAMKKEKLRLKDEIMALSGRVQAHA